MALALRLVRNEIIIIIINWALGRTKGYYLISRAAGP
jgi:hypothetical protein